MKFSISTSFYKRSHLVENLYNQIKDQTHTDWEWIVTDDFSEENNAEEILKEICDKDPRVKYYKQSRKRECFYNPQRGTTGDIVVQFDSDDYAYPRLLEYYNHLFLKHPEVEGISCLSLNVDENGNDLSIDGGGHYHFEESNKFCTTPMGRAWRNNIHDFDDGKLQYFQNDTNIVRHVEARGKWLYIPRVFYKYYYSTDTFSRSKFSQEEVNKIEEERLFIESKFPQLDNPDRITTSLYYLPIQQTARDFARANFNLSKERKSILYIKEDIKVYERYLLKELFYDQDLYFDYNLDLKFDEIIISLTQQTIENLPNIKKAIHTTNPSIPLQLRYDTRNNLSIEEMSSIIGNIFGGYGWHYSGCEVYYFTAS